MDRWRELRPVLILPTVVTVVVPALIVARTGRASIDWSLPRHSSVLPGGVAPR